VINHSLGHLGDLLHLFPIPSPRAVFTLFCLSVVLLVADQIRRRVGLDQDLDIDTLALVPFEVAWSRYWAWMQTAGYSRRTISDYNRVLHDFTGSLPVDAHGQPRWNARNLDRLAQRWLAQPARTGRRAGQPWTVATRKHYLSALKAFYHWAAVLADPPLLTKVRLLGLRTPHVDEGPARDVAPSELAKILEQAELADERLAMIVWLAWAGGLRCQEIAGARIEHMDARDGQVSIWVPAETGKGGKARLVPLHQASWRFVRGWLASRPQAGPLVEARNHDGNYTGRHLAPGSVSKIVSHWEAPVAAHQLRHTIATMMYEAGEGTNLEHVAEFLGVEPRTARRYAKGYKLKVRRWLDEVADPRR